MEIRLATRQPPACQCPEIDDNICDDTITQEDMLCDDCRESEYCIAIRDIVKILGGGGEVRPG